MALPFSPPSAIAGNDGCVRVMEMTARGLPAASVVPPYHALAEARSEGHSDRGVLDDGDGVCDGPQYVEQAKKKGLDT